MNKEQLLDELRDLLEEECDLEVDVTSIAADEPLFGDESRLGLDSLDGLAVSLEVKSRYGKHLGGNEAKAVLRSLNTLADFILVD